MGTACLPADDHLPGAAHLVGDDADDILATALTVSDGRLYGARACHVQYRPGSEAVVRYDACVSWSGRPPVRETLLASTHRGGPLPGTVALEASVAGRDLTVSVWRWPFDPVLTALSDLVTPGRAEARLAGLVRGPVAIHVAAYRPTERAVVRVDDADGRSIWVKILPPDTTESCAVSELAERHRRFRIAGVPVPEVVADDPAAGWLALTDVPGPTLRDRLKAGGGSLPAAAGLVDLLRRVRATPLEGAALRTRTQDASGHAAMLATVAPELRPRLECIVEALTPEVAASQLRSAPVHGDLHEGQLVLDGRRIAGVLDVDDAGLGDPLDDLATILAHLRFRRTMAEPTPTARRLTAYVDHLTDTFTASATEIGCRPDELRRVTAAALVGLATGPFRIQQPDWITSTERVLADAEALLGLYTAPGERDLTAGSCPSQTRRREQR
jgi:aminoglycoside phosphotransferase